MIDYEKDGTVITVKNYETARIIPSKKMTECGMAIFRKGRYMKYVSGNRSIPLTRLIYQKHIGKIPKGYEIHHIDGDKFNDDPSNLIALSHEEHVAIHRKMTIAHQAIEVIHITNKEAKERSEKHGLQWKNNKKLN